MIALPRPHPRQMTITGDLGSGKSSVATLLSGRWGIRKYSTGSAQRELAARLQISTLELNKRSETDPSIDHQIDSIFASIEESKDDIIIDSRMAWHFLPQSLKVKMEAHILTAAERVMRDPARLGETYLTLDQAEDALRKRRASEAGRFQKIYGVDVEEPRNFHLVVDTTHASQLDVMQLIAPLAEKLWQGVQVERHWVAPQSLYPTKKSADAINETPPVSPLSGAPMVLATRVDCFYYIHTGHALVENAVRAGLTYMPVMLARRADHPLPPLDHRLACVHEWQTRLSFTFRHHPTA